MRWIFFHGVFGDWGWEQLDDTGSAIAESSACFESRKEAEADAAAHGYVPIPGASGSARPIIEPEQSVRLAAAQAAASPAPLPQASRPR
jgi:hypothetical protein